VTSLAHDPAAKGRATELIRQMLARRQSMAQLLQHNQALRRELINLSRHFYPPRVTLPRGR
jgi:hypothetical protein